MVRWWCCRRAIETLVLQGHTHGAESIFWLGHISPLDGGDELIHLGALVRVYIPSAACSFFAADMPQIRLHASALATADAVQGRRLVDDHRRTGPGDIDELEQNRRERVLWQKLLGVCVAALPLAHEHCHRGYRRVENVCHFRRANS